MRTSLAVAAVLRSTAQSDSGSTVVSNKAVFVLLFAMVIESATDTSDTDFLHCWNHCRCGKVI